MQKYHILLLFILIVILAGCGKIDQSDATVKNLNMSLHATTAGMEYFYSKDQGGFELATGIPYSELACKDCHIADGDCNACHSVDESGKRLSPADDACLKCHSRQKKEMSKFSDVHMEKNMTCGHCHDAMDMHGDSTRFVSMLEPGGIIADCNNCHNADQVHGRLEEWEMHLNKFDCAVCHTQVSTGCINCHFETEIATKGKVKKAYNAFPDWKVLLKRDDKITTGTIMTLVYENKAQVVLAPYYSHTVIKPDYMTICDQCHDNKLLKEYQKTGKMKLVTWDDKDKKLDFASGTIFIPEDWRTSLEIDFVTLDSVGAKQWKKIKPDTVMYQILFSAPLSDEETSF